MKQIAIFKSEEHYINYNECQKITDQIGNWNDVTNEEYDAVVDLIKEKYSYTHFVVEKIQNSDFHQFLEEAAQYRNLKIEQEKKKQAIQEKRNIQQKKKKLEQERLNEEIERQEFLRLRAKYGTTS